jgi:DNA ligase-1
MDETAFGFRGMMQHLTIHNTGTSTDVWQALKFIQRVKEQFREEPFTAELARALVTQNLQIGIGATNLNKIWGADFIPKTGCMLGTLLGNIPAHKLEWPYIITEKLDGIRRVIIKENGVCRAYSRSGHEDTGLDEIMLEMKFMPDNTVYDGELIAIGLFSDSIARRQATMSIAQSKGIKRGLIFNVFDMIPLDEFRAGKSKHGAMVRKIRLGATLMDESISHLDEDWYRRIQAFGIHRPLSFVQPVPILGLARSMEDIAPIVEEIWTRRDEGVMLNSINGLYEIKRSKHLLKMKHTEEFVLEVVGVEEGSNKYEDTMGALVVMYKGNLVGVGTGFSDYLRDKIWANQDEFIGRRIEIESFGESTNAAGQVSLNCPVFQRFADEVHE